jgi:hypothetical protein
VTGISRARSGREAGKEEVAVEEQQGRLRFEGFPDKGSVSRHTGPVEKPILRIL